MTVCGLWEEGGRVDAWTSSRKGNRGGGPGRTKKRTHEKTNFYTSSRSAKEDHCGGIMSAKTPACLAAWEGGQGAGVRRPGPAIIPRPVDPVEKLGPPRTLAHIAAIFSAPCRVARGIHNNWP